MSHEELPEIYLARHGETAWAISGQHTGRTDIPLTERGERNARSLGERLKGMSFAEVRTSNYVGKLRRKGRFTGYASDWKKAYVRLQAGQKVPEYADI